MLFGMCSSSRKMPSSVLRYSSSWLLRTAQLSGGIGALSYGSIALASSLFRDQFLLSKSLVDINRVTTVVVQKIDIDDGHWEVKLALWRDHDKKKQRVPAWELIRSDKNGFK